MSFKPCSLCEERKPGKFSALYWAHINGNGARKAWLQRLCRECLMESFGSLLASTKGDSTDVYTCPACGGSSRDDSDPVFLTLYLPKQEPKEFELATCAACAANLLPLTQTGSEELADRRLGLGAPNPKPPTVWDDLPF